MKKSYITTMVLLLSISTIPITGNAKNSENVVNREILTSSLKEAIEAQQVPGNKINKAAIENIALKAFVKFRRSCEKNWISPADQAKVRNGRIYFQGYKAGHLTYKLTLCSTPIVIDNEGNFTVYTAGKREDGEGTESISHQSYRTTIKGTKRPDGYYHISVHQTSYVLDIHANPVSATDMMKNYQARLQKELGKIQDFDDMKKDMIAAMLAGHGVYEIDHVKAGKKHTIYADTLNSNIEIRFVKKDAKTVYGVYIISKNDDQAQETNHGSEIYAFKYVDESTAKKQRIKLMTKRVVQNEFDEEYPATQKYTTGTKGSEYEQSKTFTRGAGIFFRNRTETKTSNLDKIYENFLCEGVIHTTYTQVNGIFYKNQQRMF